MATYVLVHGGWHGGWCWKYVTPLLRAAGHEVFTPTLTGCGERTHLARTDTGLETHIQDVVNMLEYEDLRAVGWWVIAWGNGDTGVADRVAPRLAQLVYLDCGYLKRRTVRCGLRWTEGGWRGRESFRTLV